ATWPADASRSRQVDYQVIGDTPLGDTGVNQTTDPVGTVEGGRPWQLLEQVTIRNGIVTVSMTNRGPGTMAADRVMLVALPSVLPGLQTLDLRANPLGNLAQSTLIPALSAKYPVAASTPLARGVLYTPDASPVIQPIGPQTMAAGGSTTVTVSASDADGDAIT